MGRDISCDRWHRGHINQLERFYCGRFKSDFCTLRIRASTPCILQDSQQIPNSLRRNTGHRFALVYRTTIWTNDTCLVNQHRQFRRYRGLSFRGDFVPRIAKERTRYGKALQSESSESGWIWCYYPIGWPAVRILPLEPKRACLARGMVYLNNLGTTRIPDTLFSKEVYRPLGNHFFLTKKRLNVMLLIRFGELRNHHCNDYRNNFSHRRA